MTEKFDAIVVGAGPSGNACAYTMAKAGLKVLQIERGEYPGSKNVQGAILYSDALERIIPDFREDAPLERHIIEQRMWVLDDQSFIGGHYRSEDFNKPPYNRYTIIRAQFDKWFSQKVQEAGALLICETTVTDLLMDGQRVVGVQTDRVGGSIYADIVVLADGVNSVLARKAGFRPELDPAEVALAVKEIHFMPEETIASRFNVSGDAGVVIEMIGKITKGMMGTGFLYTNRDSVTIGVGCMLSDLKRQKCSPYQLLEDMKAHPAIAPLLEGGEMKEYAAHLIPEGGYHSIPCLYGSGWIVVGDSGMFVNAVHREGSNLAMTSGRLAAETVIALRAEGLPMNERNLARYRAALNESFVIKDMKKYRALPGIFHRNPHLLSTYPELLNQAAHHMLKVDGTDKKSKERDIRRSFTQRRSLFGLVGDAYKMWRAFE
ncbi:protein fixC [Herbaspirillum rubrisubalbicans]|jgi:electron transfer flavoprotein-quinone oxidoreductase|uniref:Protein FixC n=2 Tax=Herbaspirillum rubrisubalbicans TaxID=80842 RepID=A0ABX9C936_9BURK|nr:FAD-dependent oxidoreductase [Herbaspirillum rubrisubalbicans]MCP1572550.1 electron transfer flavoprotein-quinone oxidoreductase [Herbaspirillum rubrisubalbicans]NQE46931.1 protein fixC [Herbaspirillum rubrisubalbicans]QJQ01156.1 FAD-dependent oxidoreductase [Herbaspirillum rubrisubalbicans Os34]RAM67111.1 protein fixC [Herbaspirillum rubrisubalbicans]RAN49024.1 protein fixC [Herbaspirillum rubrisubalbicans]